MFKKFAIIVAMISLVGCESINAEKYHQATLKAIHNSEEKIGEKLTNLETKVNNQTKYIDSLETELLTLKKQVNKLNSLTYLGNSSQNIKITSTARRNTKNIDSNNKTIILGSVEKATIDMINETLDARVDTGAKTSSINAEDIEKFERNGAEWVRFHIANNKNKKEKQWIEAPVIRSVKIRQATNENAQKRLVVKLWVTVGNIHENTEFTLADRSQMSHPLLLGREFIRDIALVDVSKQYIHTKSSKNSTQTQIQ
ncbi:ATP-dependent zinc protease family protein [Vibrio salinus]|uniref:ATP-dependent zinc protease family protein n=1 Tax=Vibrio salinus TaxID=2899784 RepID=UPI001E634A5B|nr:ATP-dependent zinc protease [Vibrio salinus]MCE0496285.1 ATP-dependent zinc protease [Vibrio salinus]